VNVRGVWHPSVHLDLSHLVLVLLGETAQLALQERQV
jgi:hypothetical protein